MDIQCDGAVWSYFGASGALERLGNGQAFEGGRMGAQVVEDNATQRLPADEGVRMQEAVMGKVLINNRAWPSSSTDPSVTTK